MVTVTLGSTEYTINPLPLKKSSEWRAKLAEKLNPIVVSMGATSTDDFGKALRDALIAMPETMADLFFDYAPELDKEKISAEASEEQLGLAFGKVFQLAYPYGSTLKQLNDLIEPFKKLAK
jgi:hypothetical protein